MVVEMLTSSNPLALGQRALRRPVPSIERLSIRRIAIMNKLSSVALSTALVVAGVGASVSAEAHPNASALVGYPGGAAVERIGYARPFYARDSFPRGRFWRHEFERDRYERFHRNHWDRR
jgi:hypothetical protein